MFRSITAEKVCQLCSGKIPGDTRKEVLRPSYGANQGEFLLEEILQALWAPGHGIFVEGL